MQTHNMQQAGSSVVTCDRNLTCMMHHVFKARSSVMSSRLAPPSWRKGKRNLTTAVSFELTYSVPQNASCRRPPRIKHTFWCSNMMQASPPAELESLADDSKDPSKTQQLIDQRVPEMLMQLISCHVSDSVTAQGPGGRHSLLLVLRTVRNLCAMGSVALKALACEHLASLGPACLISMQQRCPGENC